MLRVRVARAQGRILREQELTKVERQVDGAAAKIIIPAFCRALRAGTA